MSQFDFCFMEEFISWLLAHWRCSADSLQFSEKLKDFGNFGLCRTGGGVPRNHLPPSNFCSGIPGPLVPEAKEHCPPTFLSQNIPTTELNTKDN